MIISLNNKNNIMNYLKKFISHIKINEEKKDNNTYIPKTINYNYNNDIKNYELNNTFLLHTDKNTPLTKIISDNICIVKIVNIISNNKIKGVININYNFLKFNFLISNKFFSTIEELYYYITKSNDIELMIDNFNNNNYFINIKIYEINKDNLVLCNII